MGIQIEQIIYIYIFVCLAMLVFNMIFAVSKKGRNRRSDRKKRYFLRILQEQILGKNCRQHARAVDTRWFISKLKYYRNLSAFHEALSQMQEEEPEKTNAWINHSGSVFTGLAVEYSRQNDMKKAYFAWFMTCYRFQKNEIYDSLYNIMIQFTESPNVYCRENALKALYNFGDPRRTALAVERMSRLGISHNGKLLTDGLLSFQGDRDALTDLLWRDYGKLSSEYRVVYINYVRMSSGRYTEEFYGLLQEKSTDKEERLALIRYFRRYRYEPAGKLLREYLSDSGKYGWETAAVSALALENYPGEDTVLALKKALSSFNWYIRYNAAESLKALNISYLDLIDVYNGEDRFAREMLSYKNKSEDSKGGKGK